jgi:hypothetical protein
VQAISASSMNRASFSRIMGSPSVDCGYLSRER